MKNASTRNCEQILEFISRLNEGSGVWIGHEAIHFNYVDDGNTCAITLDGVVIWDDQNSQWAHRDEPYELLKEITEEIKRYGEWLARAYTAAIAVTESAKPPFSNEPQHPDQLS